MKNLIILLFITIFSITKSYSQSIDYPRYMIDSLGQKVIVMTIQQAQKLDNNSDLLAMYDSLFIEMGTYDSICVKVINDKEQVIATQKLEISNLKKSLDVKDQQIFVLQSEVNEHIQKESILEKQLKTAKRINQEQTKQIRKMKVRMVVGGIGGSVAIIGLIVGILLLH